MPQTVQQQLAESVVANRTRDSELDAVHEARSAVETLAEALERVRFEGYDPYDALSSRALRTLARTRTLRQLAIQGLRRSPINVRPLVGVGPRPHAKADALLVSSYVRLDACGYPGARAVALKLGRRLVDAAVETESGVGWGYGFDVQTRWGYYPAGTPNAIVTSFAVLALLDLAALEPNRELDELIRQAVIFACGDLLSGGGSYYSYCPDSKTPIHNANVLVAEFVGRCAAPGSAAATSATESMSYTLSRQRRDGSWPYGEARGLGWVDGFHTAFVLGALRRWYERTGDAEVGAALQRGLGFYLQRLIEPNGLTRASTTSRYPVDIHAASTAIWTLSETARFEPSTRAVASRVLGWTLLHMRRSDGRFAFQLHRRLHNSIPYIRWSDAHMLLALASFLRMQQETGVG